MTRSPRPWLLALLLVSSPAGADVAPSTPAPEPARPAPTKPTIAPTGEPAAAPTGPTPAEPATPAEAVPYRIDVPSAWTSSDAQAKVLADELSSALRVDPPMPGLALRARTRMWRGDGAGLVVTWLESEGAPEQPETAARALLEHMRATPRDAALDPGDTELTGWQEQVKDGRIEASLTWRHLRNQTQTDSRALIYRRAAGQVAIVRADCVTSDDATARQTCQQTLASLTLLQSDADRQPLGPLPPAPAPEPAEVAQTTPPPAPDELPPTSSMRSLPPGGDGILVAQPPAETDHQVPTWLYLVGGALVIIGILWAMRGRSDDEPEDEDDGDVDDADGDDGARNDDEDSAGDGDNDVGDGDGAPGDDDDADAVASDDDADDSDADDDPDRARAGRDGEAGRDDKEPA
ncbi:hypothetical protein [Haliangium sp.]|uniref:hypothetical protein n=1 Tax=Haliangium sp. TaxID=2663208 RepID=UPI003D0DEA20